MSPSIASNSWVDAIRAVGSAAQTVRDAVTKPERRAADKALQAAQQAEAKAWERLEASRQGYLAKCAPTGDGNDLPETVYAEAALKNEGVPGSVVEPEAR